MLKLYFLICFIESVRSTVYYSTVFLCTINDNKLTIYNFFRNLRDSPNPGLPILITLSGIHGPLVQKIKKTKNKNKKHKATK